MDNLIGISQPDGLDETDLKIIETLRKDGRVAFEQIAEQLNVSPGMVRQRYNRLVDMGYLKVAAITNPLRMGLKTMAMIGVRVDGDKMMQVAEKIAAFDEVVYIVIVSGRYDIMAEVFCRDHAELLTFLTEKLSRVDGVRETESFMHLKIVKEIYF
mgnify:FL=1